MEKTATDVRHVVIFKYKDGASSEQIQKVTDAFRDLQNQIPGIRSFEHGVNNSPEGMNLGFTHVHILTFDSVQSRDTYLPHPRHQQFGGLLKQLDIVAGVFVVDYVPAL